MDKYGNYHVKRVHSLAASCAVCLYADIITVGFSIHPHTTLTINFALGENAWLATL